jgi:predicted glutamine amidotransferase
VSDFGNGFGLSFFEVRPGMRLTEEPIPIMDSRCEDESSDC